MFIEPNVTMYIIQEKPQVLKQLLNEKIDILFVKYKFGF